MTAAKPPERVTLYFLNGDVRLDPFCFDDEPHVYIHEASGRAASRADGTREAADIVSAYARALESNAACSVLSTIAAREAAARIRALLTAPPLPAATLLTGCSCDITIGRGAPGFVLDPECPVHAPKPAAEKK